MRSGILNLSIIERPSKMSLDWSKLLGFDQTARPEENAQGARSAEGFPSKVGSKLGSKVGGKAGIKPA